MCRFAHRLGLHMSCLVFTYAAILAPPLPQGAACWASAAAACRRVARSAISHTAPYFHIVLFPSARGALRHRPAVRPLLPQTASRPAATFAPSLLPPIVLSAPVLWLVGLPRSPQSRFSTVRASVPFDHRRLSRPLLPLLPRSAWAESFSGNADTPSGAACWSVIVA